MILICYGTRPEYIKIKPIIENFKKNNILYKVLYVQQHKDIPEELIYDIKIDVKSLTNHRLNNICTSILEFSDLFKDFEYILVQGDTTAAMAISLAAFNINKKIIHVEAGLRTYDNNNPRPEEQNRRIISQIADIHFCPTQSNLNNLINEKIIGDKYVVGNTLFDNFINLKKNISYEDEVIITMHRRENLYQIKDWFVEFENLAIAYSNIKFILPIHFNPEIRKYKGLLKKINVLEPLSHDKMLELIIKCKLIITDSGGLQEEGSFFNKKTLVCREITERSESLNVSTFLVKNPLDLKNIFDEHIYNYNINYPSPYGDGHASEYITNILKEKYLGLK